MRILMIAVFLFLSACGTESVHTQTADHSSPPFEIKEPLPKTEPMEQGEVFDWSDGKPVVFHHKDEMISLSKFSETGLVRPQFIYEWNLENTGRINKDLLDKNDILQASNKVFVGIALPNQSHDLLHMVECQTRHSPENNMVYYRYIVDDYLIVCNISHRSAPFSVVYVGESQPTIERLEQYTEEIRIVTQKVLEDKYVKKEDRCMYCEDGLLSTRMYIYIADLENGFSRIRYLTYGGTLDDKYYIKLLNE